MGDGNKKLEITQDFLEKHRNNTRKYMHLLSKNNESPSSIQETLSRIETKFGVSIKRSSSQDLPQEPNKQSDDGSLQDFIKQIRAKYLPSGNISTEIFANQSKLEPLIDLSEKYADAKGNEKKEENKKTEIFQDLLGLELESTKTVHEAEKVGEKIWNFEESRKKRENFNDLGGGQGQSTVKKLEILKSEKKVGELDESQNVLLLSDLVSEAPVPHFSPVNKPPRTKINDESLHDQEKDEANKTWNENSMTMSFRRVHAEQIINSAISEVIATRLKIHKKPAKVSKVASFDHFLNSGKIKFAPSKKILNTKNEVLEKLLIRKAQILKELEKLDKERSEILLLMNKS